MSRSQVGGHRQHQPLVSSIPYRSTPWRSRSLLRSIMTSVTAPGQQNHFQNNGQASNKSTVLLFGAVSGSKDHVTHTHTHSTSCPPFSKKTVNSPELVPSKKDNQNVFYSKLLKYTQKKPLPPKRKTFSSTWQGSRHRNQRVHSTYMRAAQLMRACVVCVQLNNQKTQKQSKAARDMYNKTHEKQSVRRAVKSRVCIA